MKFQKNDYVMYGNVGVCKVQEICTPGNGIDNLCYVLHPVFSQNSTIYAPVENAKVSIRRVISKDEATELIDKIKEVKPFDITNRREKELEYKKALKSGEHVEWARLVKTLYNKKKENASYRQTFSETDRTLLCSAEKLLNGELSIALQMPFEMVGDYIASKLRLVNES
ncbi:MAG: CarD family transcriptional regulator [Oscillospiraceae bacterium]|jgi:CarD family transcriptional regulator|nr:CarD family transcriptional regulator [Oscillospiraceae bacterium]